MARLLILGAGYLGAALAQRALDAGDEVVLADNWYATEPSRLDGLRAGGARVETADIRERSDLDRLLAQRPDRLHLLAAQASRPISERDPDYTEETNVRGVRRVAEAVAAAGVPSVVFASSLHVYGSEPAQRVTAEHPYGAQGDLAHLSKIYGELCLGLYAQRHGFGVHVARLGIVYGRSPVEHGRPESQTVIDKFRRLAAQRRPLTVDDGGRATLGAVHVDDATRILLELEPSSGVAASNVAAQAVTVAGLAAMAEGRAVVQTPAWVYETPHSYHHRVEEYLRA
ncbi:MAG: NAD-dependent epimerase/dehydratase family protein [Solirubrobacteraceae bacterium]